MILYAKRLNLFGVLVNMLLLLWIAWNGRKSTCFNVFLGRLSRPPSGLPSTCRLQKEPASAISSPESAVIMNLYKPGDVSAPVSWVKIDKEDEVATGEYLDFVVIEAKELKSFSCAYYIFLI